MSGIAAGNCQNSTFQLQGVAPEADLLMGPIPYYDSDYEMFDKMVSWCRENGNKRLGAQHVLRSQRRKPRHDRPEVALMDEMIKKYDIVACIAAGNEADLDIVQRHTFTGGADETMKAAFYSDLDGDDEMDVTEIYDYITVTQPEKQIEIDVVVFNTNTGTAKNTWKFVNSTHPDGRGIFIFKHELPWQGFSSVRRHRQWDEGLFARHYRYQSLKQQLLPRLCDQRKRRTNRYQLSGEHIRL